MATINSINSNIPIELSKGGTNASSMATTYGINYYDGIRIVTTAAGTSGQVLTSNGVGVAPTFQNSAAASVQFQAKLVTPVTNVTGNGAVYQIIFDTAPINIGSGYNTGTGIFTAPTSGNYLFSSYITITNQSGAETDFIYNLITTAQTFKTRQGPPVFVAGLDILIFPATVAVMVAGDTAKMSLQISGGAGNTMGVGDSSNDTFFCGYIL